MKTLQEYLTESKKVYSFKIKIACPISEEFDSKFKSSLEKYSVVRFEKTKTTPVQETPMDFPEIKNTSVSIYEVDLEYPVIGPQIATLLSADFGISESCLRVRSAAEQDIETAPYTDEKSGKALLTMPYEKGAKFKDYFGDAYNKSFLKDLENTAKQRKKDLGHKDIKVGSDRRSSASA